MKHLSTKASFKKKKKKKKKVIKKRRPGYFTKAVQKQTTGNVDTVSQGVCLTKQQQSSLDVFRAGSPFDFASLGRGINKIRAKKKQKTKKKNIFSPGTNLSQAP